MRFVSLLIISLFIPCFLFSQQYKVSGYVKDVSVNQTLPGVSVYIEESQTGSASDANGYYHFTVPAGDYHLHFSLMGYRDTVISIKVRSDTRIDMGINSTSIKTQTVNVLGEKANNNVESSKMGTITLETKDIKTIPVFMGEQDIIKVIELLPGVQSAGDANTGFYVRGGGPDENLILLDGATVYNAGHLLGFFSIFNSDAISDAQLIKGNMPANYGGRISSVLAIDTKNGDMENYHASGGIGLIASHVTIQGPIKKDTSGFIFSARRTYLDVFLHPPIISASSPFNGTSYFFYDLNGRVNYRLSAKDQISITGYYGQDVFNFNDAQFSAKVPWGNAIAAINWNHIYSDKLLMTTSFSYTSYNFKFSGGENGFSFNLFSGIHDYHTKINFDWLPTPKHNIKFGVEQTIHVFIPSAISAQEPDVNFSTSSVIHLYGNEAAIYADDEYDLSDRFKIDAGLRYSLFQQLGPFTRYVQNSTTGQNTDTINYKPLQSIAFYDGLEPRFSLRYQAGANSSFKIGYSRNLQYIHLASISSVSLPTDIWFPCTSLVAPTIGDQYAAGFYKNFKDNLYESSVEVYYKHMQNLIEYKDGTTPEASSTGDPDENFTFGTGNAYGIEFFLKKRMGKLNGWIGYTLSWTTEDFPELNSGQTFYAKYDRRNDISAVANYELNDRWTFSSVFVFASGEALTMPVAWYIIEGSLVQQYGDRNGYRLAPYNRLDVSATYTPDRKRRALKREAKWNEKMKTQGLDSPYVDHRPKWVKNLHTSWSFSVYNVYDRYNPYFIYFAIDGNVYKNTLSIQAKQVSLFPILPSVSWNFDF
ncbi:MAG TPA: TonB-dependent receptor [Bacteroidia bacterium]|nr:TonB-dependent receptor [Bacteroidia bacterium]